jgi:hypothetical protein
MYDSKEARKNSEVGTWKTAEFLHPSYLGIPMPVPTEVPTYCKYGSKKFRRVSAPAEFRGHPGMSVHVHIE